MDIPEASNVQRYCNPDRECVGSSSHAVYKHRLRGPCIRVRQNDYRATRSCNVAARCTLSVFSSVSEPTFRKSHCTWRCLLNVVGRRWCSEHCTTLPSPNIWSTPLCVASFGLPRLTWSALSQSSSTNLTSFRSNHVPMNSPSSHDAEKRGTDTVFVFVPSLLRSVTSLTSRRKETTWRKQEQCKWALCHDGRFRKARRSAVAEKRRHASNAAKTKNVHSSGETHTAHHQHKKN